MFVIPVFTGRVTLALVASSQVYGGGVGCAVNLHIASGRNPESIAGYVSAAPAQGFATAGGNRRGQAAGGAGNEATWALELAPGLAL